MFSQQTLHLEKTKDAYFKYGCSFLQILAWIYPSNNYFGLKLNFYWF